MKIAARCALVLGILVLSGGAPADARNLAVSFFGTPDTGNDFEAGAYRASCMKDDGWEVHSVPSAPRPPADKDHGRKNGPDEMERSFDAGLSAASGLDSMPPLDTSKCPSYADASAVGYKDSRSAGARAVSAYVDYLRGVTKALGANDQFMLEVFAHGNSNCRAGDDPTGESSAGTRARYDMRIGGASDQAGCDHWFQVVPPGCSQPVLLATKDLIPVLKELKARGVKTAVELRSCYGGAALKDFAEAGICAHAYSTPDASLIGCTGAGQNLQDSATLEDGYFCSQSGAGGNLDAVRKAMGANASPGQQSCQQNAVTNARTLGLASPQSMTGLFDRLRSQDPTANQPVGTDGPFWAVGALGLLGGAAEQGIQFRSSGADRCLYHQSPDEYFRKMYKQLKAASDRTVGKSCSFESEWRAFVDGNRAQLTGYFHDWGALSDAVDNNHPSYADGLQAGQSEESLLRKLAGDQCQARNLAPDGNACAQIVGSSLADPQGSLSRAFLAFMIDVPAGADPRMNDPLARAQMESDRAALEQAYGGKDGFERKLSALRQQRESYKRAFDALKGDQAAVSRLERQLYQALKSSQAYRACIEGLPPAKRRGYEEAKKGCEDFKL